MVGVISKASLTVAVLLFVSLCSADPTDPTEAVDVNVELRLTLVNQKLDFFGVRLTLDEIKQNESGGEGPSRSAIQNNPIDLLDHETVAQLYNVSLCFDKPDCEEKSELTEELLEEFKGKEEFELNLVPYLEECKERQNKFVHEPQRDLNEQEKELEASQYFKQSWETIFGEEPAGSIEPVKTAIYSVVKILQYNWIFFEYRLHPKYQKPYNLLDRIYVSCETNRFSVRPIEWLQETTEEYESHPNLKMYVKDCVHRLQERQKNDDDLTE
jgi:hypothetical protein